MPGSGERQLTLPGRLLLALAPLSTGGAVLVALVVSGDSLVWPTLVLVGGTGLTAVLVSRRLEPSARTHLAARVRVGLLAGLLATAAYDVVRFVLVAVLGWSLSPFTTFPLFGQMLVGDGAPLLVRSVVGSAFHLLNGLGFAVGYLVVFPSPRIWTALAWALVLEAITVTFYPSWLGVTALGEFLSMSALGHLAYGVVLAVVARRGVGRPGPSARAVARVTPGGLP
jgi:hypothetical protein